VNRLSEVLEPAEARKRAAADFSKSRTAQDRTRGYRCAVSGKAIRHEMSALQYVNLQVPMHIQ